MTYFLNGKFGRNAIQVLPQLFSTIEVPLDVDQLRDTRQRPFKSLVACFKRSILDEVLSHWRDNGQIKLDRPSSPLYPENVLIEDYDFDLRLLTLIQGVFEAYRNRDDREWLNFVNRPRDIADAMQAKRESEGRAWDYLVLIDRIDESWDGSDKSVILLMALMHACVELTSSTEFIRPLVFLRENIFERVRQIDNEFARLETFVVSVDWTRD